ncbi:hypothetical protein BRC65_02960 [Halobacteriales archaeon QH_2_65_14]|nr:MAG: hypothetical protein BRC65_02960 [Halobacteriales archaeon QH_2_65_14]
MSPGQIADHTFDTGFRIAAVVGVFGSLILFGHGVLSVTNPTHVVTLVLLFPVYLLFVAVALGVWLGYETDETDLERVKRDTDDLQERWP